MDQGRPVAGKAGGTRETNPWTQEEVAAVLSSSPSKKRDKQLADIGRCLAVADHAQQPSGKARTKKRGYREARRP